MIHFVVGSRNEDRIHFNARSGALRGYSGGPVVNKKALCGIIVGAIDKLDENTPLIATQERSGVKILPFSIMECVYKLRKGKWITFSIQFIFLGVNDVSS